MLFFIIKCTVWSVNDGEAGNPPATSSGFPDFFLLINLFEKIKQNLLIKKHGNVPHADVRVGQVLDFQYKNDLRSGTHPLLQLPLDKR